MVPRAPEEGQNGSLGITFGQIWVEIQENIVKFAPECYKTIKTSPPARKHSAFENMQKNMESIAKIDVLKGLRDIKFHKKQQKCENRVGERLLRKS